MDSKIRFPAPAGWPDSELLPGGDGHLPFVSISFGLLKEVIIKAHNGFVNDTANWPESTCRVWLKVHGINERIIDQIMDHALNAITLKDATANKENEPGTYDVVIKDYNDNPYNYQRWSPLAVWDLPHVVIDQHIDIIMHMIFLGVAKRINTGILEWATLRRRRAAFVEYAKDVLEMVKVLQLDWCKVLGYREGTLGGWVSDQHLGWVRVAKWFYGTLGELAVDPGFVEPDRPFERWTLKHNQAWLRVRGLDSSGPALTLRARVHEYRNQEGGPPAILPPRGGPVAVVNAVIISLNAMVARTMVEEVTEEVVSDLQRHVKIFLNCVDKFDSGIRICSLKERNPLWIQSSNFVALLNLPKAMERFGPPRELWEGGPRGEGILRELKPLITGLRGNWAANALRRFYQNRAFEDILSQLGSLPGDTDYVDEGSDDEFQEDGRMLSSTRYRPFRYYADKDTALQALDKSMPLSIIQLSDGRFGFVTKENKFFPVQRENFRVQVCGASYFEWSCNRVDEVIEDNVWQNMILHHCLFLPRLAADGKPEPGRCYYVITSQWLEMNADGSIGLPDGGGQQNGTTYVA
jgi:hypothetical protein